MTVCIDAGATNSAGSTCLDPYGASAAVSDSFDELGSPMRAYFSGLPLTSGNTNENSDIDNVPYLDVIFPAWETGGFGPYPSRVALLFLLSPRDFPLFRVSPHGCWYYKV